jgi:hypothetical protein
MYTTVEYEAPGAFYRAEEGGETVSWRRNGRRWVKLFNAFVLDRREGAALISEGKMSMWDDAWFPHGEAIEGCSSVAVCANGWQPELGIVWIDPRWKTINWASYAERLFGLDTVMEIKHCAKIERLGKRDFWTKRKLWRRNWGVVV